MNDAINVRRYLEKRADDGSWRQYLPEGGMWTKRWFEAKEFKLYYYKTAKDPPCGRACINLWCGARA